MPAAPASLSARCWSFNTYCNSFARLNALKVANAPKLKYTCILNTYPMSRYASYEKFFTAEQAEPILDILKENGIPYEFAAINEKFVDPLLAGGGPAYEHEVKI